jgi:UDP-glucose 6-dehydrogenase
VADVCEAGDADVSNVAVGLGLDSRIGPKSWMPGSASVNTACQKMSVLSFTMPKMLHQTELINQERVDRLIREVQEAL